MKIFHPNSYGLSHSDNVNFVSLIIKIDMRRKLQGQVKAMIFLSKKVSKLTADIAFLLRDRDRPVSKASNVPNRP